MRYIIETKDERDKDSSEPWSFFGAYDNKAEFLNELDFLASDYIFEYPIVEFRVRIERVPQESEQN